MAKHVSIAYFLWFFFGVFGLHHFYLGRDRHAFFTWATIGGVFGIGVFRDLFRIPKYTAAANETTEYMTDRYQRMTANSRPGFSTSLFISTTLIGWLFGLLVFMVFWDDDDMHPRYYYAISALAHLFAACGVYYISNEGENLVPFKWCFLGSFLVLPFTLKAGFEQIFYGAAASTFAAWNKVEWRRTPRTQRFCTRVFALMFVGFMWWGMIGSAIYFNGTFEKDGQTVKIRDAAKNFFKSPAWRETKEILKQMYEFYQHHGWSKVYEQFLELIDPQGENNAYEILGLNKSATQEEIKKTYKQLARRWHPDKVKDPEQKKVAQEKFMEIQEAYNILSDIQKGRKDKVEL